MKLYNDDSRCDGKLMQPGDDILHPACDDCLRLRAPRPEYAWTMPAPEFFNDECHLRIKS